MTVPKKKPDPWKNKESEYIERKNKSDRMTIHGQIEINGIIARFKLNEQVKGEYLLRGNITLLSPATGRPLECIGLERKRRKDKKKNADDIAPPVARCNLQLKTLDKSCIRNYIVQKASELISKNALAVQRACSEAGIQTEQTLSFLIARYGRVFLDSKSLAKGSYESQLGMLQRAGAKFGLTPVAQIDSKLIRKVQKSDSSMTDRQIHLASNFWDYCHARYGGLSDNPFDAYLSLPKHRVRDGEAIALRRSTPEYLFSEQERVMDEALLALAESEPLGLAPILAKDAGIDVPTMLTLSWRDILFDSDDPLYVRIRITKPYAGWTADYTRPVFFLAARALRLRYTQLSRSMSEAALRDQYILSNNGKKPDRKQINDCIRQTLTHLGIEKTSLVAAKNGSRKTAAGTQYLLNTYKHKVEAQLGLEQDDPAAVRFLLGRSLSGDVTADHYRSFASPEGQRRLYIAMRRWGASPDEISSHRVTKKEYREDGRFIEILSPEDPEKKTIIEFEITLKPGEELRVQSNYGIMCEVIPVDDTDESLPSIPWHKLQSLPEPPESPFSGE